jgi:hypothetical protein
VATAIGRIAASQLDQPLLDVSLDLDLVRPWRLGPMVECRRQPFGNQSPPHPLDGSDANAQGSNDVLVGAASAEGRIGEEKNAGVGQAACCGLPGGNCLLQLGAFLSG